MISVIIPVKNREKELIRAVSSVLNQALQESVEVLVVDDKSGVNIKSVVESFQDRRVVYILNESIVSNANVCRNIGIQAAKGDYIAMLDSDDEWLPNHLEQKVDLIRESKCDGVFGSYIVDTGVAKKDVISRPFKQGEIMVNYLLTDGRAQTSTQVYTARAAKQITWDENLLRHQDLDFSVRFAEKFSFSPCEEITCVVHWKEGEKRAEHLSSQIEFIKKHKAKITHSIYNKYHANVYASIRNREDVATEIATYFREESTRYIHDVSLNEYLAIHKLGKSSVKRALLRIQYLFAVLFS